MRTLDMQMTGVDQRMSNARSEHASQQHADDLQFRRLEARLAALGRVSNLKKAQLETTRELAAKFKRGEAQGIVAGLDAERLVLDAGQLETEVEQAVTDQDETRSEHREASAGHDDARRAVPRVDPVARARTKHCSRCVSSRCARSRWVRAAIWW